MKNRLPQAQTPLTSEVVRTEVRPEVQAALGVPEGKAVGMGLLVVEAVAAVAVVAAAVEQT